jgi:hypothetical protein
MGIGPDRAGAAIITTYFLVLVFCAFLSFVFAFLLRFDASCCARKASGSGFWPE